MKRRFSIFIILFISILFFFLTSRGKPKATELASNSTIVSKAMFQQNIKLEISEVPPDVLETPSSFEKRDSEIDPDRDYLLWRKESDQIEAAWNEELYNHIQYIDRDRAEELYRSYLSERKIYLVPEERHLSHALDDLSELNGESIGDQEERNPEMDQDEFITKLRRLFRQHYGYIEMQRKIFLDFHSEYISQNH